MIVHQPEGNTDKPKYYKKIKKRDKKKLFEQKEEIKNLAKQIEACNLPNETGKTSKPSLTYNPFC